MEGLKDKLQRLGEWAKANLLKAQQAQKGRYDKNVRLRELQPGDKVRLLLPSTDVKLLARWQGPYLVRRRIGEVNYEIEMPDRRDGLKVFHVNLLKRMERQSQRGPRT